MKSRATGKLPHSIGKFNSLNDLDLSSNSLSDLIPTSTGNLSNLRSLNLEGNMLNGKILESIVILFQLEHLHLLQNNWEDTMTSIHVHNLTNLFSLSVSSKNKLICPQKDTRLGSTFYAFVSMDNSRFSS